MTHRSGFLFLWMLVWILVPAPAEAQGQRLEQRFEQGLLYDQCFAGDNVGLTRTTPVLEGSQQLITGPLDRPAFYMTPFLRMTSNAMLRFKFRNQAPAAGTPRIVIDLIDATGNPVSTIFQQTVPSNSVDQAREAPLPSAGVYRVRIRFEGTHAAQVIGFDELRSEATFEPTEPSTCHPQIPGVGPTAVADSASSSAGQAVVIDLLANDIRGDNDIVPGTVDLVPSGTTFIEKELVIRDGDRILGTATVDASGHVTVTPSGGASGTLVFSYSVRDTAGRISNTAQVMVTVLDASTDLQVTLGGPTATPAGSTPTYTAVVENLGPAASAASTLTFEVAGPLTPTAVTCPGRSAACTSFVVSGNTATVQISGLGVGQRLNVMLESMASSPGAATVTATITPGNPATDPMPGNNTQTVSTTIGPAPGADIGIELNGPAEVFPGRTVTYTMTVTNTGPDAATGVVVQSNGPPGAVFVGNEGACSGPFPCALGTVPVGAAPLTITSTYSLPLPPGFIPPHPPLLNSATVSAGAPPDPNPSNNSASVSSGVVVALDVGLRIAGPTSAVPVGQTGTAVVVAANRGPMPARSVPVVITWPAGLEIVSATPTSGTINPATATWTIPEIDPGDQHQLIVTFRPRSAGSFEVAADAHVPPTDVQASNDQASISIQATASADLAVQLSASTLTPVVGQQVQIVLRAGNYGPSGATGVSVQQSLPAGLQFVSAVASAGTFEQASGTWTIGAIPAQSVATLTTTARVDRTGPLAVSAAVTGAEFDPVTGNNGTAMALNAAGSADLQISMSSDNRAPVAGEIVDFVGTLTNRGPTAAQNVVVTFDLAPPGSIAVLSVTASAGTFQGNQLIVGTLAPNAVVTVTARVQVLAVEPIRLTGTARSSTFDPLLANNVAAILMNSGRPPGTVTEDFESRTGAFVCWAAPGMSPGGLTASGEEFGQTALNPPLQLLVHMVSGPLANPADQNALESPWIRFSGQGTIAYLTKIDNVTSGPVQTVSVIEVATGVETVIYNRAYSAADSGAAIRDTVPITFTGIYKIRWSFAGSGGISRAAIDDIVIDGELATAGGDDSTLPYDCRPNLSNPPEAHDDFASTALDTPVVIAILANDVAPESTLNPASVTLDPVFSPGQIVAIDVFQADGTTLGHATVDASGQVTFTPAPGATGSGVIPYAVKNDRGALSNIAYASVVVGTAATDVETEILGPATANPSAAVTYTVLLHNNGPGVVGGLTVSGAATNGLQIASVACTLPEGFSCGLGTVAGDGASFSLNLVGLSRQGPTTLAVSTVTPAAIGPVALTVSAALASPVTDTNPANNSATATTAIASGPPVPRANLSIRKTGPHWITAGDIAVYTLTITNGGPDAAAMVSVEDPPPPGFTQLSVTGHCAALPCSLGDLQPGALRQVTVRYSTDGAARSAGGSPVVNRATVSSATEDPNPGNNVSEVTTLVHLRYDLSVTTNVAIPVLPIEQAAVVAVEVRNHGPLDASGVVVSVPIASGFTFLGASPAGVSYDPATGSWAIGDLAANATVVLELTVTVDIGPHPLAATIVGGLAGDTNSANNQSSVTMTGLPSADLALSSTVSNDAPVEGEVITIVLTARNHGPSDATGIVIAGVVPAGLTLQSVTASSGTVDAATQTWSLPSLPVGTAEELSLLVRVDTTGVLNPSALVATQIEIDVNNANNTTGVLINAGPSADIQVDISMSESSVAIGEPVSARVTVVNAGPSDAANTIVQAQIPAGVTLISMTPSTGVIDEGRWVIGTLAAGASATLDATGIVQTHGGATIVVNASSSEYDPEPTNNTASASINSVGADVRLTVFPGTPSPFISANATMYVRVTNEGPGTALGVSVPITIAPGLARITELLTQGTFDAGTGTWTVGSLPPYASAQMAIFVRVLDGGVLPITGEAMVSSGADLVPDNNQAFGVFDVVDPNRTVADMQLAIAGPPSVVPGSLASFVADSVNNGSTYAVDVTTTVDVPSWASFVSATPSFGGSCVTPAPGSSSGVVRCTWTGQSVVGQGRLRRVEVVLSVAAGIAEGTALAVNGSVTSLTLDPFTSNNVATAQTVANAGGPSADIRLAKFLLADGSAEATVPQGQTAIYRVVVTNAGAETASGVEISETVLPELPIVRGQWSQGTVDQSRRLWSVGTLAPGAVATLDIEVRAASSGRFVLPTARLSSAPFDPDASNDRASILVDVPPAGWGGRYVATGNVDGIGSADVLVGTGLFEPTQIRIFSGDGRPITSFYPYDPRFMGGVRVAACDIDADGRDEIITAAGPGGGPHVRVVKLFPGDRITEFLSFYAAPADYAGGVYVACGDVTGDGIPEVIVGAGLNAVPELAVWEVGAFSFTEIARMRLDTGMATEIRVATCDVDGDGRNEVIAGTGAGPAALVAVIDPLTRQAIRVIRPLNGHTGGVYVACGDLTSSVAGPEIVVSSDAGSTPLVEFYSADGARLTGVFSESPSFRGGVRVAVGDVDPTPMSELIAVAGYGGVSRVRVASGSNNVLVELRTFVSPNVP